jgi:hypothetical protein
MPEQPRGFFEGRVRGELIDRESTDHELSPLPIDVTETRDGRDNAFKTAVHHAAKLNAHV